MLRGKAALITAFALTVMLASTGCGNASPAAPVARAAEPTSAPTATVTSSLGATLSGAATYSGNVQTKQQVSILAKVSGRVTKLYVDLGSAVKTGDPLVEVDHDTLAAQVAQTEAGLQAAQAKLDSIQAGPREEAVTQAEANLDMASQRLAVLEQGGRAENVAQAQANLDSAKARLEQVKKGTTSYDLEAAQLAVEQGKSSLWMAQTQRDGVCGNGFAPKYQCDAANAQVALAETSQKLAETRLAQAKAGATAEQITQAEAAVSEAEQQLSLAKQPATEQDLKQARDSVTVAEAQLALVKKPATQYDVQSAQAAVAQAKAAVDIAKATLAESTIRAPFDGVVSQRLVTEGALVGPQAPILTLISAQNEVVISVEETVLSMVKVGDPATVVVTAFPDESFRAKITNVAPSVDPKSRTAQVRLAPEDSSGKLRDGMFARVSLGR